MFSEPNTGFRLELSGPRFPILIQRPCLNTVCTMCVTDKQKWLRMFIGEHPYTTFYV